MMASPDSSGGATERTEVRDTLPPSHLAERATILAAVTISFRCVFQCRDCA